MTPRLLVAALALGAAPVAAQPFDCASDQTQMALNWCAGESYAAADRELNRLWATLKPRADAAGRGDALLQEQRQWLARRDATCDAERDAYAGGSIAPLVHFQCLERLTLQRNADLRSMM